MSFISQVFFSQNYSKEVGQDPDVAAFLSATGITNTTIINAIETLVSGLKTNNLWTKMKVIYPIVGGTADLHKWNLKDPRDLDAAFRLTFNGIWTHNSSGMVCNTGSNWVNTHILPNTDLDRYSNHFAIYSTENRTATTGYSGASSGTGSGIQAPYFIMSFRSFGSIGGQLEFFSNSNSSVVIDGNADVSGLNVGSRLSDTSLSLYRQKIRVAHSTTISTSTPPANKIAINTIKTGTSIAQSDNKQFSFISLGDGLNQTDIDNLFDVLDSYQTILGRKATPTGSFPSTPV